MKNISVQEFEQGLLFDGTNGDSDVENSIFKNNSLGIDIWNCDHVQFKNNYIINNFGKGIKIYHDWQQGGNTISFYSNNISNNNDDGLYESTQDELNDHSRKILLQKNIIENNGGNGVEFSRIYDVWIYNNSILGNKRGAININGGQFGSYTDIYGNTLSTNSEAGIQFTNVQKSSIHDNNINGNGQGVYLTGSSTNNLWNNTFTDNVFNGILLSNAESNTIMNNWFNNKNNIEFAIIKGNTWNMTNSTGPNIIGGPFYGGNCYANPSKTGYSQTCSDSNGDGFCDVPYTLEVGNIDNLPLHMSSDTHTIVATAGPGGSISPSGNVIVKDGEDQTFIITPNNCYDIQDVVVDSISQGPVSSYPFTKVTKDHTISATFTQKQYTINAHRRNRWNYQPSWRY